MKQSFDDGFGCGVMLTLALVALVAVIVWAVDHVRIV